MACSLRACRGISASSLSGRPRGALAGGGGGGGRARPPSPAHRPSPSHRLRSERGLTAANGTQMSVLPSRGGVAASGGPLAILPSPPGRGQRTCATGFQVGAGASARHPRARFWGGAGPQIPEAGPTRSAPGSRPRPARAPPPAHRVPSQRRRPEPRGPLSLGAPGAGRPHGADGAARTLTRPRPGPPRRARGSRARWPAAFGLAWEP